MACQGQDGYRNRPPKQVLPLSLSLLTHLFHIIEHGTYSFPYVELLVYIQAGFE